MARRSFQRTISQKQWDTTLHGRIPSIDVAEGTVAIGDVGALSTEPFTLLRTRGRVMMSLDSGGLNEHVSCAMGLIVVSENAFGIGVTAVPSPVTDGTEDWIWHDFFQVNSGEEAAVVNDYLTVRLSVDSKAMRKLRQGEVLVIVAEIADSVDATGNVTFSYGFRQLIGV